MRKADSDTVTLVALGKALAHPARLTILDMLSQQEDCVCNTLVKGLPLAQSTVSQHLAVLKNAGLIQGTIRGTSVCYCLDSAGIQGARDRLAAFWDQMAVSPVSCCPPDAAVKTRTKRPVKSSPRKHP